MIGPPPDHAVRAYEVFAAFYDDFTSDHEHDDWARMIEEVAIDAGLAGKRLLDVACGTGSSFLPLLARGYEVTACDISPAMLKVARARCGSRASLSVQDMRDLPHLGEFDLVWCLGDALNYLHGESELVAAFEGMHRCLAPGGVVAFDINTLGTFRSVYSSLRVLPGEQRVIVLDGHGDDDLESGGVAKVWIDRLAADGDDRWSRARSVHHHYHHSVAAVEAALSRARLSVVGLFGSSLDGLETGVDELRHIKAVFTARAAGAPEGEEGR